MKKSTAANLTKNIPEVFKTIINYFKDDLAKNSVDALNNANGTIGLVIKLFGQSAIDKYYDKKSTDLLADFGLKAYMKAGFKQAELSLKNIEDKLPTSESIDLERLLANTQDSIESQLASFDSQDVTLVFLPQYHPAVEFAKDNYVRILRFINSNQSTIDAFKKDFNANIKVQVKECFGDDYDNHLERADNHLLNEKQTKFLVDMSKLGRIGMKQDESLKYEQTYASWQPVHKLAEQQKPEIEAAVEGAIKECILSIGVSSRQSDS